MHQYWAFGLRISSEIQFPELLPVSFEKADITITTGKASNNITGATAINTHSNFIINEKEYFLDVINVCRYYATDGKSIVIDPYEGIDERSIRLYLLGTVIAATLFQRGRIPLHASGIIQNNKLVLFTGDSGAGKSTTVAALSLKGYKTFTDDVCVVYVEDEKIMAVASYPMMKLWHDTIGKLNNQQFDAASYRLKQGIDKYGHFFHNGFETHSLEVEKIFVLKVNAQANEPVAKKINGMEAFWELKKQVYRNYLMQDNGIKEKCFNTISQLVNSTVVHKVIRPIDTQVDTFISFLQTLL